MLSSYTEDYQASKGIKKTRPKHGKTFTFVRAPSESFVLRECSYLLVASTFGIEKKKTKCLEYNVIYFKTINTSLSNLDYL